MGTSSAAAAVDDVGFVDIQYGVDASGPEEVTAYHSQSKLWYNDGYWWAVMYDDDNPSHFTANAYEIYRLDVATQTWEPQGVKVEDREKSSLDVLSAGDKLYVIASNAGDGKNIRFFRYSYNNSTDSYSADLGPDGAEIPNTAAVNYATITRVGADDLWVGYAAVGKVWTDTSTDGGDTWQTDPSEVPVTAGHEPIDDAVDMNDDVAVITTVGSDVGIMWSRTSTTANPFGGFFFAEHSSSTWTEKTAWAGSRIGDNHVSLKTSGDRVIVAVKTGQNGSSTTDALIGVLDRDPLTGDWANPETDPTLTVSSSVQAGTRPMLVLDEGANQANVFITKPVGGGVIYRRTADLATLDFGAPSLGDPFIRNSEHVVNDSTSTKQAVDTTETGSGLTVLATDSRIPSSPLSADGKTYLHNCVGGQCGDLATATTTTVTSSPNPSASGQEVTLTATVQSAAGIPSGTVSFTDGGVAIEGPQPLVNGSATLITAGLSAGSHDVAAEYQPDDIAYLASSSTTLQHTVNPAAAAATTTTLASSPNPSTVGNVVSLTATVTVTTAVGTPTGTVTFMDGATAIGAAVPVTAGSASTSTNTLTEGTHSLTAAYTSNSGSFADSTSAPVSQIVQAVPPPPPPPPPGAPIASFTTDRTDGRAPLDVQFTDASTGGPTSWSWEFGDGTTSTEQNPLHTYVGSGTYTAKLTVANTNGSTSTTTAIVVSPSGNRFMPVTPTRVLTGKTLGPNSFTTITLKTPPGSNAVALNVTATKVSKGTMIAVCANDQTAADCVTHGAVRAYRKGSTAGFTISDLDPNDAIKIYNSAGTATVNLDVQGWFVGRPQQTTYYTGLAPAQRLVTAKAVGHKMYKLAIPAALRPPGTVAVGLNITAANPSADTKIAVCGLGQSRSECARAPDLFSNGNRTVTNYVVARLRAGGTVKLLNTRGTTRLTVDIQGSYSTVDAAALFRPNPQRRLVTARGMTPKSAFTFTQRSLPPGTTAVVLRVTVSSPTTNGSLSVCQGGVKKKICKATSVLAVQRHRTTTNVVVVQVGTGGTIKFYNAAGKNKLTVDAIGSFGRN